jgi:hypothetical protein
MRAMLAAAAPGPAAGPSRPGAPHRRPRGGRGPGRAAADAGRAAGGELAARADLGDAGELLDATAKAAYKARLEELRAELEEAEDFNDPARAAAARREMDAPVGELARRSGWAAAAAGPPPTPSAPG